MRTTKKMKMWLVIAGIILAAVTVTFAAYFQSFETDTSGWFDATRVSTGTHGVPSKSGAFHAENLNPKGQPFTRWGGYSQTFPPGGYTTSVDIYLDIAPPYMSGAVMPYANDTRFDWTSAISTPACGHRRDFVFNAGFYTDVDATGRRSAVRDQRQHQRRSRQLLPEESRQGALHDQRRRVVHLRAPLP